MSNITKDTNSDEMFDLALNAFDNFTEKFDLLQVYLSLKFKIRNRHLPDFT